MVPTIDFTGLIVAAIIIVMIAAGGIGAGVVATSKAKMHKTQEQCEKELPRDQSCVAVWVERKQ